jgi:hypothetical protein
MNPRHAIPAALAAALASPLFAQSIPNFTVMSVARSRQLVDGIGVINSAFIFSPPNQGGRGILKVSVNNNAQWLVHVDTPSIFTDRDNAILSSSLPFDGGFPPYLQEGVAGFLSAPTSDFVATDFGSMEINNAGAGAFSFGLLPFEGADPTTDATSGVYRNLDAILAQEGQPVTISGIDPGAVWARFAEGATRVDVNDSNRFLLVAGIIENGSPRNVVVTIQTDANGQVTSRTLVAKEGGPVGAGPDTWTAISTAPHASAVNNSGAVIFTGTTAGGTTGIYTGGHFVATTGGPTPVAGKNWGSLLGVPVDLSNTGHYAFRAQTANGSGVWNERSPDAGEQYDGQNGVNNVPADSTFGNGPLTRIVGSLSDDHDVDMYRIHIDDYAAFSASTVPDPGAGFPGAAFDTVLYLIRTPGRGTAGVTRSDDAAVGVVQSAIGHINLPAPGSGSDNDYYLAVCTRKARPFATEFNFATQQYQDVPIWEEDPAGIAVHDGIAYWSDPSAGAIRRADASGNILSDLVVSGIPDQNRGPEMISPIAVYHNGAASKLYWIDRQYGEAKIRRCALDGSNIEIVISGTTTPAFDATALAIDSTHGRLYWTRNAYGEIYRANADGTGAELMIKIPTIINPPDLNDFAPTRVAADPVNNRVYWINAVANKIQRAAADVPPGSNESVVVDIITDANAADLVIDSPAGKLYWTSTIDGVIHRANLDGSGAETFLSTARPGAITLDSGMLYWSNQYDRVIRRSSTSSPAAADLVNIGRDIGDNRADGPGYSESFAGWDRIGAPAAGALPYQVRLTGAGFRFHEHMVVRDTQKVAIVGDALPDIAPNALVVVGTADGPVDVIDDGRVLWYGAWTEPSPSINILSTGLFINDRLLVRDGAIPSGISDRIVFFYPGAHGFSFSDNGRYMLAALNTQEPPFNFTFQSDNALLFTFDVNTCPCDWNQSGGVNSQDFFDFLNDFFAGNSDFNHDNVTNSQDFFDFLTCFFAGCP